MASLKSEISILVVVLVTISWMVAGFKGREEKTQSFIKEYTVQSNAQ